MRLTSSVRSSLDTALGVALVPYFAPKHHPRAARLLSGVLDAEPTNSEARFARAQIHATAGEWPQARAQFQMILDQGGEEREVVAAKEEVGWCLVNEGQLNEGRETLEEVVQLRDTKWEESGKEDEALPRARAWWKLGRVEWMIGGKSGLGVANQAHCQTRRARRTHRNGSWRRQERSSHMPLLIPLSERVISKRTRPIPSVL